MKFDNYKIIKKSEWQVIATQYGIEWDENSVVRYLVEKIAEKIGVDDKIVSDNKLKKKVIEVINANFDSNVPVEQPKSTKKTTKKETKTNTKKVATPKEPVIEKVVADADTITAETPAVQLSRLEQLRLECESYGIVWTDKHSEANLEQVLNGVKNAGVQPVKPMATNVDSSTPINTNELFEITSDNASSVANSVANMLNNPAFNPLSFIKEEVPVNGGYKSSNAYLNTYSSIYLNAIRGHWRLMSINEITEMINRDKQSFTYSINHHPQQSNKIEILLIQGSDKVRVPSNESEWIDING